MTRRPAVYVLVSRRNGTRYIGTTSDLVKRVCEHKNDVREGSVKRYGVHTLVYYQVHAHVIEAIRREKQLKN